MINQYSYMTTNNKRFKDNIIRYKPFNFKKDYRLHLTEPKRQKDINNKLEQKAKKTHRHYIKVKNTYNVLSSQKNFNEVNINILQQTNQYIKINGKLTPLTHVKTQINLINQFEKDLINKLNIGGII